MTEYRWSFLIRAAGQLALEVFVEEVAEAVFFGSEIIDVVFCGFGPERYLLDDLYAVDFEATYLFGIIGQYAYVSQSEVAEDLCTDSVIAFVGGEAELDICLDGVEPLLLELVCVEFVFESYASSFLAEIDEGAFALLFDHLHSGNELVAALTSLRMEQVAGHTFGVDTDEDWLIVLDCLSFFVEVADAAFAQGQMRFGACYAFVADELKFAVVGGQGDGYDALDLSFSLEAIFDEFCDGGYPEVVLFAEFEQLGHSCH